MTAAQAVTSPELIEKRKFPKCHFCGWQSPLRLYTEAVTLLKRLTALAERTGEPLTRRDLAAPFSDHKCPKCKSIVVVCLGDLLRN